MAGVDSMHACRGTVDANAYVGVALCLVPDLINEHEYFTMHFGATGCNLNLILLIHLQYINQAAGLIILIKLVKTSAQSSEGELVRICDFTHNFKIVFSVRDQHHGRFALSR